MSAFRLNALSVQASRFWSCFGLMLQEEFPLALPMTPAEQLGEESWVPQAIWVSV